MPVSPMSDVLQTPSLWRLAQCVRQHQDQWQQSEAPPDLERFERAFHDQVMAVDRDLLADALSRYAVAADDVTVAGVSSRRSLESTQTSLSAAGPITVSRHLYRPAGRSTKSICPLELRAGIVQGLWTPTAARQGACVMAHLTSRESAMLCEELGGMQPSVSTLDRLPKTLSARFEAHREGWEGDVRARETVPEAAVVLAVSRDGVMAPRAKAAPDQRAPTAPTEPEAPAAGDSPGKRNDREAGCGTVTLYDAEGKRLSTVRYGRMPE